MTKSPIAETKSSISAGAFSIIRTVFSRDVTQVREFHVERSYLRQDTVWASPVVLPAYLKCDVVNIIYITLGNPALLLY